jgi:agmatinase
MNPGAFLDLPLEHSERDQAGVVIVPLPYETTVTYGPGTVHAPAAILKASTQVELYDREFDREPALDFGIHVVEAPWLPSHPASMVDAVAAEVVEQSKDGHLVVGMGGEHSVSVGVAKGLADVTGGPLTVVQIDAHSDLRDSYEGEPYSHACVARRILDDARVEQVLQLAVRSLCPEEAAFAKANPDRVGVWYAEAVHANQWREELVRRVSGRNVFITIDVDGLDPSLVPNTGTPEPDGLSWSQTLDILRTVSQAGRVVGLDCVELAPQPGDHAPDYAVAKLLYKAITYAMVYGRGRPAP